MVVSLIVADSSSELRVPQEVDRALRAVRIMSRYGRYVHWTEYATCGGYATFSRLCVKMNTSCRRDKIFCHPRGGPSKQTLNRPVAKC